MLQQCSICALLLFAFCALEAGEAPKESPVAPPSDPTKVQVLGEKKVERTPDGCAHETFKLYSVAMQRAIECAVLMPPAYAKGEDRYPVLYALHGKSAPYLTMIGMMPLRRALKDKPMLVVSFNGDTAGWYLDATKKPNSLFSTFYFKELVPFVDAQYRTIAQASGRGVTGFSMGGFGAFQYMLTSPEKFAGISSLSGAFHKLGDHGEKPDKTVPELLGPYEENKSDYLKFSLYNRLETLLAKGVKLPPLYIACGMEDGLLESGRTLRKFLQEKGLKPEYLETPGNHDYKYWCPASVSVIDFHWRTFQPKYEPKNTDTAAGAPAPAGVEKPATK